MYSPFAVSGTSHDCTASLKQRSPKMRIVMKQAEVGYGVSHQSMELAVEKCRQAMRA